MDQAAIVRMGDGVGELDGDAQVFAGIQRTRGEPRAQRFAVDHLHRDEVQTAGVTDLVDRADVRMVERCCGASFADHAPASIGIVRELTRQQFQRNVAPECRIVRAIHLPHSAGAERRDDLVGPDTIAGSQGHEAGCEPSRLGLPRNRT